MLEILMWLNGVLIFCALLLGAAAQWKKLLRQCQEKKEEKK